SRRSAWPGRVSLRRRRPTPTPPAQAVRTTGASSSSCSSPSSMTGASNVKRFQIRGFALCLILLPACGRQLVEFGDAGADAGDAGLDTRDAGDAGDAGGQVVPDTTPPTVVSTSPTNAAASVSIRKRLTATFSEPMSATTLTATTFTVRQGTTPVPGTVSYA